MSGGSSQPTAMSSGATMRAGVMPKEANDVTVDPSTGAPFGGVPPAPAPMPTASPMGGFGINPPPGTFYGTPYNQTYGTMPSPYASLGVQIQDAFNIYGSGAGRFAGNNLPRFGFGMGGFNPFFRPTVPNPGTSMPNPGTTAATNPAASPYAKAAPGTDHMSVFNQLYAKDPRLAYEYTQRGPAQQWFHSGGGLQSIRDKYFGGIDASDVSNGKAGGLYGGRSTAMNNWINSSGGAGSNVGALTGAQMQAIADVAGPGSEWALMARNAKAMGY